MKESDRTDGKRFISTPFLVTIDGPDGAGKSTFSEFLTAELQRRNGAERVKLVRPTRFDCSSESQLIGGELETKASRLALNSRRHNAFFLRTVEINYRNVVVPAIRQNQLVIVDSSELRALAFILERGTSAAKTDTINKLRRGVLTCGIKPSKRIIMQAVPEDLLRNLHTKSVLDIGDPRDANEIRKRIRVYNLAMGLVRSIEGDDGVKWIFISTQHTSEPLTAYWLEIFTRYNLVSLMPSV